MFRKPETIWLLFITQGISRLTWTSLHSYINRSKEYKSFRFPHPRAECGKKKPWIMQIKRTDIWWKSTTAKTSLIKSPILLRWGSLFLFQIRYKQTTALLLNMINHCYKTGLLPWEIPTVRSSFLIFSVLIIYIVFFAWASSWLLHFNLNPCKKGKQKQKKDQNWA